MDSTYQLLHLWLVSLIKRISPSSANAVSVSIDGVAGGKVTARDRAASSASEGGRHRRPYFFINYFSINWFHQTGYYTSFWAGFLSNNSKLPNHQNGEIIYPKEGSTSPKWNRLTAVENFYPQNGDFLFSVENSGSHNIYLPDLQTKAVLSPKTRTGQKQK